MRTGQRSGPFAHVPIRIKRAAAKFTQRALRRGDIARPSSCSSCGDVGRVECHHRDYTRPTEIAWLCKRCHWLEHTKLRGAFSDAQRGVPADAIARFGRLIDRIAARAEPAEAEPSAA